MFFFFKNPKRKFADVPLKQKLKELDPIGAGFLISAIVCLLLALTWGGLQYPWRDSKVWGCFLGFGLLIAIFIAIQVRLGDSATIPLRVLKQRSIAACALTLCLMSMGLFTYVIPFALGRPLMDRQAHILPSILLSGCERHNSRAIRHPRDTIPHLKHNLRLHRRRRRDRHRLLHALYLSRHSS